MLTEKQRDLLIYIHEHIAAGNVPPSFDEMKDALGLKSKSGIHRLINALVERGYLERLPNRARALAVKKLPENYVPEADDPTNIAAKRRQATELDMQLTEAVPLLGKIAAGTPITAIRDEGETIDLPPSMLGRGNHYALRVEGDSMIRAGINDADIVLIKEANTAHNGTIVVALVDDEEVTLKRFRRAGNKIILEPENESYEPRVLDPERVKVQGHLVGLYRTYH